jgi:hypothetical protein
VLLAQQPTWRSGRRRVADRCGTALRFSTLSCTTRQAQCIAGGRFPCLVG